jgi:phage repressor protein C with HTH and peptisase S24 domain
MEPYLYYDELFMINAEDRTLKNQEKYAFLRGESDYFVSQVLLLPNGGVRLHSFNSPDSDFDFAPGKAEKELSILGRVFFRAPGATQMDMF